MTTLESLKESFVKRNINFGSKTSTLKEYLRICLKYGKEEQSFVDEIEAKLTIHPDAGNPNLIFNRSFISSLERDLKKTRKKELALQKKKSAKRRSSQPSKRKDSLQKKRSSNASTRKVPFIKPEPKGTPKKESRTSFSSSTPSTVPRFQPTPLSERKKLASKEEVVLSYSCQRNDVFFNPNEGHPEIVPLVGIDSSEKYMTDSMITKSEVLSDTLCVWAEQTLGSLPKEDQNNIHPLNALPNTEGIFWGRILSESQEGYAPLNRSSILLEGFKDSTSDIQTFTGENSSESTRIAKLDLSSLYKPYVFYPGQAVCVRGRLVPHPLGTLKVKEVISAEVRYCPSPNEKRLNNTESIHIMVASGPFTTRDNLEFYPLMTVLEVAQSREVDLLILLGPFLSKDNEWIANDKTLDAYEDIMRNKVMGLIQHQPGLKSRTSVILIPSLKDVHQDFVYPQPPYYSGEELDEMQLFHRSTVKRERREEEEEDDVDMVDKRKKSSAKFLHSFSNPCVFGVKNVRIGATSLDVFNQVKKVCYPTVVFPDSQTECYHILKEIARQNLFFPTYCLDHSVPFDFELADRFFLETDEDEKKKKSKSKRKTESLKPDILIIPSSKDVFVVEVDNMLVINPGKIIKGRDKEGTYAHIVIEKNFLSGKLKDEDKESNPIKVQCIEI